MQQVLQSRNTIILHTPEVKERLEQLGIVVLVDDTTIETILWQIRLPRTLAAVILGGALGAGK